MYSGTKIAKASYLRPYTREDSSLIEGKELALSRRLLSSSGGRSAIPAKKKAPSRSALPLSRHVVLKTTYVNPIIHVRRYQIYVRRRSLSTIRPRLLFALVGSHSTTALSFSLRRDEPHIAWICSVYREVLFSGIADYKFFFLRLGQASSSSSLRRRRVITYASSARVANTRCTSLTGLPNPTLPYFNNRIFSLRSQALFSSYYKQSFILPYTNKPKY